MNGIPMRRRDFLITGISAATLAQLPLGDLFEEWITAVEAGPRDPLFSTDELNIWRALADVIFPEVEGQRLPAASKNLLAFEGKELDTADRLNLYLARKPKDKQDAIKKLIHDFNASTLTNEKLGKKAFVDLPGPAQAMVFSGWLNHPEKAEARRGAQALRTAIVFSYFVNPKVAPLAGYRAPKGVEDFTSDSIPRAKSPEFENRDSISNDSKFLEEGFVL